MNERELLTEKLRSLHDYGVHGILDEQIVLDFILADRKRICEPLVKWNKKFKGVYAPYIGETESSFQAVDALCTTIKLAGLEPK